MTATPEQLRTIWPVFAEVSDDSAQYWLDQALPAVASFGTQADHAQLLLGAHYLTINGIGAGADAQLAGQGLLGAKSIRSGSLSVDFGEGGSATGLATTSYGRQFMAIAAGYIGGAMVTDTGTLCGGALDPRIPRWPC